MSTKNLKETLKPLIKECLMELLFEEKGVLSSVINEVLSSKANNVKTSVMETKSKDQQTRKMIETMHKEMPQSKQAQVDNRVLSEASKMFGGLNPFEGTAPLGNDRDEMAKAPPTPSEAAMGNLLNQYAGKWSAITAKLNGEKEE
jgi:gas vesicle protein